MTKFRLDVEYDYDFFLAGISCHEKPHRLCWAINKSLECSLARTESLSLSLKKNEGPASFILFSSEDKAHDAAFFLVSNKCETGTLVPEHHQADFFYIVKGPYSGEDQERMLRELRTIPFVLMAYRIDPASLKSKQNLLF
ncbi:MAG TPA: IPExxxVDY family protein [Bacteroidia bacterium]|nr:IPExxxVDY family protein [Bacteroidia bacterium]